MSQGRVAFVGAGPGMPGWLTRAGAEALSTADVVLVDALVNPALLTLVPWEAEIVPVGKRGGRPSTPQEEICRLLVERARAGRRVVRLKGGDPLLFGRLAEELAAVEAAGIPIEVHPGITAAAAAAARARMPLTSRDEAASLTLLTGHRRASGPRPELDWAAAARSGTIVVYMGVLEAEENVNRLLAEGLPPETPVLVVRWASTRRERFWHTTLAELPETIRREGIRPPAVWLVGGVTRYARPPQPPRGMVALFRPDPDPWLSALEAVGWWTFPYPAQRIRPPSDAWAALAATVPEPETRGWVFWSSPTAVAQWFTALAEHGLDLRAWSHLRYAVPGRGTAAALARHGLRADLVLDDPRGAAALVERLVAEVPASLWWYGAEDGDPEPRRILATRGWHVHFAATHRKEVRPSPHTALELALQGRWLTHAVWTAPSQVACFGHHFQTAPEPCVHVAIGEPTRRALAELGLAAVVAEHPHVEAILAALAGRPYTV